MHSRQRTIDDMMCISDGCDPHHYIKGRSMIGGMIGGMAKFNAEGDIVERKDVKKDDDEIEGTTLEITDYIDMVNDDSNLPDKQKFNEIMKQRGDLLELYDIPNISEKDKNLIENKLDYITYILSDDKYSKYELGNYFYEEVKGNPLYEAYEKTAETVPLEEKETLDTKRGDINEDNNMEYDNDTGMLQDYDGDKSDGLDSKNISAYDPQYIQYLAGERFNDKFDLTNMSNKELINLQNHLKKNFLRFYPIDTIKNDTLWELKSYKTPTKNDQRQDLQETKIKGFDQYQIRYKQNNKGEWVVDNIYDKVFKMNTLPNKPNGYKYYWGFNNKDGIANANPLKSPSFIPIPVRNKTTGDILYYKGDWNDNKKITKYGRKLIQIDNSELQREPNRYSNKYLKKINKFGIKK